MNTKATMKKLIFAALLTTAMTMTASAEGIYTELVAPPTRPTYTAEQLKNPNIKPNGEVVSAEEFAARSTPTEEQKAEFYASQATTASKYALQSTTETTINSTEKKSSITITVGDETITYYKQDYEPDPNAKMGDKRVRDGIHERYFAGFGWVEYDPNAVAIGIVVDGPGDINKQVGYMG